MIDDQIILSGEANLLSLMRSRLPRYSSRVLIGLAQCQSPIRRNEKTETVTPRFHNEVGHMPLCIRFLEYIEYIVLNAYFTAALKGR